MKTSQDLTNRISNDLIKIGANFAKLQRLKEENKISEQMFCKKVYVEIMKAAHIRTVLEEADYKGIELDSKQSDSLLDLFDVLCENADIQTMDELTQEDLIAINTFASKYEDIIPNEDLSDFVQTN